MASRRARLKAVANLPVRRKPGAADDPSEPVKAPEKIEETPVIKEEVDCKKNQEEKENSAVEASSTAEVVTSEPEKNEPNEKKEEKKPAGPAKFNRRLKPVVNLPVRKERAPTAESEKKSEVEAQTPENKIPDPVNNESSPELKNVPENSNAENASVIIKPVVVETEVKTAEKIVNTPQSPVKATQRPVFLRPNVDVNFLRPSDEPKTLTRVRNISESSSNSVIVQNLNIQNDGSSRRNVMSNLKRKRPKSNDLTRKMADARREFHRRYEKIKPDRSSLRMIDLIFYNPTTNPMISKNKTEKKENQLDEEIIAEEKVDDPDALDSSKTDDDMDDENLTKMPVPQVKIGLNGEIILDEKSLVIETTDAKKGREDLQNSVPVFEDRGAKMSYYCRKSKKSKDWSDSETKRFYKALNTIGTDFLLMQQIFPNRTRLELKNKFKREEKLNVNLVNKALNNPSEFDMTQLEKDLEDEKRIEEEEIELKLQKKTKPKAIESKNRQRSSSLLSKETIETDSEISNDPDSLQYQTRSIKIEREKMKKIKEANMLYDKILLKKTAKIENEAEAAPVEKPSDQNENFTISDFNIKDYKTRRKEDEPGPGPEPGPELEPDVENSEAMDLSVKKPKEKKISRKRKSERIERKKKRRKKDPLVIPPDVEEPEVKKEDHVVTRTITDQDFFQLLAANVSNMKDSNIKVQVTEDYSPGSKEPGKKIEIIFDEVPPITLKEIEDQNIKVLADYNHTICEDESPQSPEENIDRGCKETSVIVKNPNVVEKNTQEEILPEEEEEEVENENCMLVIDEDGDRSEYQYMMVEQEIEETVEEVVESEAVEEPGQNVDVENVESVVPNQTPALVVCKNPKTNQEKMCIAGLSAGSFVLMASDQQKDKKLSMFMISEKSQSDGSSVLSSMPVMLPPELLNSLTQELDCS